MEVIEDRHGGIELAMLCCTEHPVSIFARFQNHIHGKKIIHRDIKSLNLFLDANNNIKVRSGSGGRQFLWYHSHIVIRQALGLRQQMHADSSGSRYRQK